MASYYKELLCFLLLFLFILSSNPQLCAQTYIGNTKKQNTAPADTSNQSKKANFDYGDAIDLNIPESDEEGAESTTDAAPAPMPVTPATQPSLYSSSQTNLIRSNKLVKGIEPVSYSINGDKIPEFTDAEYAEKLAALATVIPMEYDEVVGRFIKIYTAQRRDQIARMLPRTDHFFRIFEDALSRYGLPIELKYLPVMQSALIPHAKTAGGAGLWQLPYGTARLYGLEANTFIDERFDPLLSTEAAVQHLRNLFSRYRDWRLTIVAFNVGEGTVNKAVRRSGGRTSYTDVVPFLSEEAQSYVPLYTAAVYTMNYYPLHNIVKYDAPYNFYATDTVRVYAPIELKEVAATLGMSLEEIQFLNPAVIKGVVPRMTNGFALTVPASKVGELLSLVNAKMPVKNEIVLNTASVKEKAKLPVNSVWNYKMNEYGLEYVPVKIDDGKTVNIDYTVKYGDSFRSIADTYDCEPGDIKRWNKIANNKLMPGQTLIIKVPKAYAKVYENIAARKQPENITPVSELPEMKAAAAEPLIVAQYITKEGDTLDKVADSFNVTKNQLMIVNKLTSDKITPGITLKIPAPKR
ncbi:MAG TPA: LysM peptidoglycan-binding domain-containing protein [Chitinophagales bacterium]|nr:LysM peptidoglycan-binding domain-containing protein [Chitinophagales bacterium]